MKQQNNFKPRGIQLEELAEMFEGKLQDKVTNLPIQSRWT